MAALVVPAIATPAAAVSDSCSTSGASGSFAFQWSGKYRLQPLQFVVSDTKADGHHVAIRLVTHKADGSVHVWGWRHNYGGSGNTQTWETYAYDSAGIKRAGIDVAVMEGNDQLNMCGTWVSATNPNW